MALTVIDAGVLIGHLDATDAHHETSGRALRQAQERGDEIAVPASALAEALVGPVRRGPEAVAAVRRFLARLPVAVLPLDDETAVAAATLRARHRSLKLPDALVIATAVTSAAAHLVTIDRGWPPVDRLSLDATLTEL